MSGKRRRRDTGEPTFKERLADAIDISKDVMLGVPTVTMLGDRELTIRITWA